MYEKLNVLIVDDVPNILESLEKILKDKGVKNIVTATNGKEALDRLEQSLKAGAVAFDLVISDINMPELNGIRLLKRVKTDPDLKNIPIVMLTTRSEIELVLHAVESGAFTYLIKPFEKEKIEDLIEEIADKKKPT